MSRVHASCVSIGESGVLLRGAPGSGKSDLALRLIDGGARLVADDQVEVTRTGNRVVARAPASIRGLLEVRGLGIIRMAFQAEAALCLVIDLADDGAAERLPAPDEVRIKGVVLPCLALAARHASAPAIARLAVTTIANHGSLAGALGDAETIDPSVTV